MIINIIIARISIVKRESAWVIIPLRMEIIIIIMIFLIWILLN